MRLDAPDGITVADLVGRGRHPHQRWFRQFSDADHEAITTAMAATGVAELAERPVDELSGGQQRPVRGLSGRASGVERPRRQPQSATANAGDR